ncbi:MAG: efflux RND transporter periplasmic adaptor subunit [Alphaproteobacteria bacterium]|nr:efflux RND transporter periplasmic adaptor subunit [Alphaproteobacteria bacterium]
MGGRWTGLLLAAMLTALSGCGEKQAAPAPAPATPPLDRLTVAMQTVADLKPVPATLTTRDMADARARISGVLVRLTVREGDPVRKGEVIGQVQDNRIGIQTRAYDAQVAAASAQASAAQADLTRTRDLFNHGVYAQARLDQVEARAKAADGALAAARAERAASAELGAQGAIVAPGAGTVLQADVPAGSVVMPGQSIVRITSGPVVVRITLPEADAAALKVGDVIRLDGEDMPGGANSGAVSQIYPEITDGQVTADVTVPGLTLAQVGRKVRAWVGVGVRQAMVIPRRYVVTRYGVDYVALVGAGGAVFDMPVETAPGPTPDTVEILSGLHVRDVIAAPGAAR